MQNACMLFGHRETPERVRDALTETVERHIVDFGVNEFFVGHYGGFDSLAVSVIKTMKARYPHIQLFEVVPYYSALRECGTWEGADGTFYPPGQERVPKRAAIVQANRYMIEHCGYLIVYAQWTGNAKNLLEWARRKSEIHIVNIADEIKKVRPSE